MKFNSKITHNELRDLLEELHDRFNRAEFIENDPISIPHSFTKKEDIEISGFFAATLAWGQRKQIIKSASWLMELMDYAPADFVCNSSEPELKNLKRFYYRTFQFSDLEFFIRVLKDIYSNRGGLEKVVTESYKKTGNIKNSLTTLYTVFENIRHEQRNMKHIANVTRGSSAKRLNMFLRWMIRNNNRGVDFGLWKSIPASALYIPLDVHSGRVARELNILKREQNDWPAVEELTTALKIFDAIDPVKYDFALFGAGVSNLK